MRAEIDNEKGDESGWMDPGRANRSAMQALGHYIRAEGPMAVVLEDIDRLVLSLNKYISASSGWRNPVTAGGRAEAEKLIKRLTVGRQRLVGTRRAELARIGFAEASWAEQIGDGADQSAPLVDFGASQKDAAPPSELGRTDGE